MTLFTFIQSTLHSTPVVLYTHYFCMEVKYPHTWSGSQASKSFVSVRYAAQAMRSPCLTVSMTRWVSTTAPTQRMRVLCVYWSRPRLQPVHPSPLRCWILRIVQKVDENKQINPFWNRKQFRKLGKGGLKTVITLRREGARKEYLYIPGGGGFSHILAIRVCATGKGIVFKPLNLG